MKFSEHSSRKEQPPEPKRELRKEIFPLRVSPEAAEILKAAMAASLTKHHHAFKRERYHQSAFETAELIWEGLKNDKKVEEGGDTLDFPINLSFSDGEIIKRSIAMRLHTRHSLFQFAPVDASYGYDRDDHEVDKWDSASCLGTAEIIMGEFVKVKIVKIDH